MRGTLLAFLAMVAAGCLGASPDPPAAEADTGAWAASELVLLTTDGPGFEPSIDAGPDGVLHAAAAKAARSASMADGQLADWAWFSLDGGATWQDLASPMGIHRAFPGLEGDTAVDGLGRFYYADTFGPDYSLHRWSPGADGPRWDYSKPLATAAFLDDRPWLAAHGDGILYLLSNTGPAGPVAGDLAAGDLGMSSKWLFTSHDGGMTWSAGRGLGPGSFCEVAASPADDRSAWIACTDGEGAGAPLRLLESRDRGATWTQAFGAVHQIGTGYLSAIPFADRAGIPGVAWLDERVDWSGVQDVAWAGTVPGRVLVAHPADGAWRVRDVTPFAGRFGMLHACAGSAGLAAVVFYATEDLAPGPSTEWFAYAAVLPDVGSDRPAQVVRLMEEPASVEALPPRDLFECAVDHDDAVHVAVQRNRYEDGDPGDGIRADVLHVRVSRTG